MNDPATIALVDLGAVAANIRELRRITNPDARIMAVVKADAYGHGDIKVSETALSNGADALGVARIEEGRSLRKAGISAPILVLGHIPEADLANLIEYDLTATLFSLPVARAVSRAAAKHGTSIRGHIKIDTGMGRLGLLSDDVRTSEEPDRNLQSLASDVLAIAKLPGIDLEGIYTHFATADRCDSQFASHQFSVFLELLTRLKNAGLSIPIRHAANSGAIIHMPETHLDMVRPGISLYGLYPAKETDRRRISLVPAMSLKSRIIHLKKVPAHFPVSYGGTYQTDSPTIIATVPVGYADGYSRAFSNCGYMLVRGQQAPVIGRVCMDLTLLDVGHIPDVRLNDEVVVFGSQGSSSISADDLADRLGTINYEVVTSISHRIPRVYVRG